jgi:transcriptional regulator with PAS, ATPase and Fis domain
VAKREGRFELAHNGTILLDEISEISPQIQAKLLRVLQERELERVGGNRTIKVDVRVIATTNRRLEESVERKEFRQDLFFRLNVVPISVPPLRQRQEDVPFLAENFLQRFTRKHGVRVGGISDRCLAALKSHYWPGNVRELQNVIERAVILCEDAGRLEMEHLGFSPAPLQAEVSAASAADSIPPKPAAPHIPPPGAGNDFVSLAEIEKYHIFATLEKTRQNRTHAARLLGISIRTLRNKLNDYRLPSMKESVVETRG